MSGLGSTLHIAKDALITNQYGLAVTGNNIANVNNADYSRQSIEQVNKGALPYGGFLFGIGVDASQVTQSVNQLLENRLTGEKAGLSGYEEAESYMRIIEDHFNESSENSISNVMTNFWNSWNDLSNNPSDDSERHIILENGKELSERFNRAYDYLELVDVELSSKMITGVDRINDITEAIAQLNEDIMGQETQRTSNDKRDQRNALLDELGELINVNIFEQPNGAVVVNVGNGFPIINAADSYRLSTKEDEIFWYSASGTGKSQNITDQIDGGKLGGWLDIKEEIIPEYQAELDELSHEVIWAINSQHAQGAGLSYFPDSLTGDYAVDQGGWLSSLPYGDKIDYSEDLTLWIEDNTTATPQYSKIEMDMGVSQATLSNWQAGADLMSTDATYKLTVVEGATIGNLKVTQSDGGKLGVALAGSDAISTVMKDPAQAPITAQTLVIGGGANGEEHVEIAYAGGDAKPSAASIAAALNNVDGVTAHASESTLMMDVSSLGTAGPVGSTVRFGIYVDGVTHYESFTVDPTAGEFQEQFEDAFLAATESLNAIHGDEDLTLEYDASNAANNRFKLVSQSGKTIGLEGFEIQGYGTDHYIEVSGNGADPVHQVGTGTAATIVESAVVTGTLTIEAEPGISISSSQDGATGGLFSDRRAEFGSSILTLGGEDGYQGFHAGDSVTFTLDDTYAVTVNVPGAAVDEQDFADALYTGLTTNSVPPLDPDAYTIVQNGLSISLIKSEDFDTPLKITDFTEIVGSGDAILLARTGTGSDTHAPQNDRLTSGNISRNSTTSSLYADEGIILWEVFDGKGLATGQRGLLTVEDAENIAIMDGNRELLTFDISAGSLVAGNTLSVNVNKEIDSAGNDIAVPDPLTFTIRGDAKSQSGLYQFSVRSGGTIGILPDEGDSPITIEWDNGNRSGIFTIDEPDPPLTPAVPYEVEVDGMTLRFTSGTLLTNDVFTITTDDGGKPVSMTADGKSTGEMMSDWHWTLDSFSEQFNKVGQGMTASVNDRNQLVLSASETYHTITNVIYSEDNGFIEDNITIEAKDWHRIDFEASMLQFNRSASGDWRVINDPTGGNVQLLPSDGDDDALEIDLSGDGLADMTIRFDEKPTGAGSITLDLEKHDADDIGFAFSDASGMMAANGINTFFKGDGAMTMSLNDTIEDTNFVAAATIDAKSGEIYAGDNSNTLAMADLQFISLTMRQWNFTRGEEPNTNITTATLDGYYSTMLGALGLDSQNIQSAREFADLMVNYITEERDAISGVSLDEEMVKLIEYQQAFNAASKLVATTDEMLNTLINIR